MGVEWILNAVTRRWGLNKRRNLGSTSALIRAARPDSVEEWEAYYHRHGRTAAELDELGDQLHARLAEVTAEIAAITPAMTRAYIRDLAIGRTFAGYRTEVEAVARLLADGLPLPIEESPPDWDHGFDVDYVVRARRGVVGVQVKPPSIEGGSMAGAVAAQQRRSHAAFAAAHGGKVLTVVYGETAAGERGIRNPEVVDEIRAELERLG